MQNTPLTYLSLTYVLKYMEANQRFQLSAQCPSIGGIEKSIPIYINCLFLSWSVICVNNVKYNLGIIKLLKKSSKRQKPLEGYQIKNAEGGEQTDIDEFGCYDSTPNNILTPGDIKIDASNPMWHRLESRVPHENPTRLSNACFKFERMLTRLRGKKRTKKVREEIYQLENLLLAYRCRLKNVKHPYHHYIQLTITNLKTSQTRIERVVYNKKLYQASKTLSAKLFAGRSLNVGVLCLVELGVIRWPESLNMKVLEIEYWATDPIPFQLLVDPQYLPLATTSFDKFSVDTVDQIRQNEMLRTASSLNVGLVPKSMFNTLATLPNEGIDAKIESAEVIDFLSLIDTWIADNREPEAYCVFDISDEDLVKDLYKIFCLLAEGRYIEYSHEGDVDYEDECLEFPDDIFFRVTDSLGIAAYSIKNDDTEPSWTLWIVLFDAKERSMLEIFNDYF